VLYLLSKKLRDLSEGLFCLCILEKVLIAIAEAGATPQEGRRPGRLALLAGEQGLLGDMPRKATSLASGLTR